MRPIELLAALQTIDIKLDAHRKRYAEIQVALKTPATLQQAQNASDEAKDNLTHWRKEHQNRETVVADQIRRIKAQEQQLYGGRIKNVREQVALQKNVESLKRHLDAQEEAVLEAMMELDQAETTFATTGEQLSKHQASWAQKEAELLAEKATIIAAARKLKNKRTQVISHIPASPLKRYEALRNSKQGVAVATLNRNSCSGCGATLPTALHQQLYGDDLVSCPLCGRLLTERLPM